MNPTELKRKVYISSFLLVFIITLVYFNTNSINIQSIVGDRPDQEILISSFEKWGHGDVFAGSPSEGESLLSHDNYLLLHISPGGWEKISRVPSRFLINYILIDLPPPRAINLPTPFFC